MGLIVTFTLGGLVSIFAGMVDLEKQIQLLGGEATSHSLLICVGICILVGLIMTYAFGLIPNGSPLGKIDDGSYTVVSIAKVSYGQEKCLCLVLKQTDKDSLYFYLLPEDWIITKEIPAVKPSSLKVSTKQGIKKVVLNIPPPQ